MKHPFSVVRILACSAIFLCLLCLTGCRNKEVSSELPSSLPVPSVTRPDAQPPADGEAPSVSNGQSASAADTPQDSAAAAPSHTPQPSPSAPDGESAPPVVPEYERQLAAAMIYAIALEHPDFDPIGIYTSSATPADRKLESKGVYIVFHSGGTEHIIQSLPLREARTQSGTYDIGAALIGFATFEEVPADSVSLANMTKLTFEELDPFFPLIPPISLYPR